MDGREKSLGISMPASANEPNSQVAKPFFRCVQMLSTNCDMPFLIGDQVAEESDGVGDDQADGVRSLLEQRHQLVFELAEDLDDLAEFLYECSNEALVRVLNLFQRLVGFVERGFVFLRELLGQVVFLVVDALRELLEAALNLFSSGSADRFQVWREARDVGLDLSLTLVDFSLSLLQPCF